VTAEQQRILRLADLVRDGDWWTTYGAVGEVVYGVGSGAQTVGNTMRDYGRVESAHRVLRRGGKVSGFWKGVGGGPEEAVRRLRNEGIWDDTRDAARKDRFIDAEGLRRLEAQSGRSGRT
jgi:alkylated DNA nucleotide flippase Atl1